MHAAFASDNSFSKDQLAKLDRLSDNKFRCYLDGNGLMARKDNKIISTWNVAFAKLQEGAAFKNYCDSGNDKHGDFFLLFSSLLVNKK